MKRFCLVSALALLAAGCSTYSNTAGTSHRDGCLDASRTVRKFEQVGPREVLVTIDVNRVYRVELANDCPVLAKAESVSFANGHPRMVGRGPNGAPFWANSINGNTLICGSAGDRLMVRERFDDFSSPQMGCRIQTVERVRTP